jgi:hypothetical protein
MAGSLRMDKEEASLPMAAARRAGIGFGSDRVIIRLSAKRLWVKIYTCTHIHG